MEFGPRLPGSEAHAATQAMIYSELEAAGWAVNVQQTEYQGQTVINLVGKSSPELEPGKPWIVVGAHYDSRLEANMDPDLEKIDDPVPGANDGASGVGVLLELARSLPSNLPNNIWLVFFDAEDNGSIDGWDWIMGSNAFVAELAEKPDAAVIIDMIGDADLNIYYEKNSDSRLLIQIWDQAAKLGFGSAFIPEYRHRILDDHIPFLQAGIPAVDLIDFDYPYWHTTSDTADKVSPESLYMVGETLWHWLQQSLNLESAGSPGG
jgi:Zn-dependent M28 family amino/carboxypeptidase